MQITRRRPTHAVAAVLVLAASATACGGASDNATGSGVDKKPAIGIDLPRSDSDFWYAYAQYLRNDIGSNGVNALSLSNSQYDAANLAADVRAFENLGAKAIVMAPQDTAIASILERLAAKKIPVVSVDTRPDKGQVYMVVRADNRAYGTKACEFLGKQLGGKGKVAELQGALDSINGRDRSEAFAECMKTKFPKIQIFELATDWKGDVAAAKLRTLLTENPDLDGIYMQAGGVFLQPTLALLQEKGLLKPAGKDGHISIVSNDGTPQELAAIHTGNIDATVSQPADLYAKYALYYAEAAAAGKEFKPGATDHDSTITKLPNGLEDQLPAQLVTKSNVNDKSLWGNNVG
ncbi:MULTISPECIES: sugar ABC transporter substrate-binding protein [unclassified Streptomyces]|uniref:sugar ABC transporter substrate-binding protein n=1 Tax=unclassified Streptomyces TaxID=2593676 RepID=UPI000C27F252|nr:sugar ABC transporter substrate-binding protein [Streptomyces sp. CB02959]PJN40171.1 ABC transporter substrate-binding protein [Streptomyces sp. CB02959]